MKKKLWKSTKSTSKHTIYFAISIFLSCNYYTCTLISAHARLKDTCTCICLTHAFWIYLMYKLKSTLVSTFYCRKNLSLILTPVFYGIQKQTTNCLSSSNSRLPACFYSPRERERKKRFNNTSAKINLICLKTWWQVLGNSTPFCRHWLRHFFLRILAETRDGSVLGHIKIQFSCNCSTPPF